MQAIKERLKCSCPNSPAVLFKHEVRTVTSHNWFNAHSFPNTLNSKKNINPFLFISVLVQEQIFRENTTNQQRNEEINNEE